MTPNSNPQGKGVFDFPFKAVWRAHGGDMPVTILGELGPDQKGNRYFKIKESSTGVPFSQLELDVLHTAQCYFANGLSVIPIKPDGSKSPGLTSWKLYQQRQASKTELARWFGNGAKNGVAIVGGKVSGNLEILDFDAPELIPEWRELVEEAAPGLLDRLPQVETPTGGLHLFYRCPQVAGNQKLAERETEVPAATKGAKERDGRWYKTETTIETRAEGGYVLAPGSHPSCHSLGKPYRLINGDLSAIPTITAREHEILFDCARSFHECAKPADDQTKKGAAGSSHDQRPGDDFNARADVRTLLEKHGWKYVRRGLRGDLWQRPGGDHTSATLYPDGSLYVFSTNAAPFDSGRVHDPFRIYALLEHAGDIKEAAKALAAQGYGSKPDPSKGKKADQAKSAKARTQKRVGDITFTVLETGKDSIQPGVWATDADGNRTFVCSPLLIEADTRDERGENWGRLLVFADRDGVKKRWAMPMSLLAGDGREFREQLLSLGLDIAPGAKARNLLSTYLNTKPEKRVLCVTRQGWHRGVFVLPDESIGESGESVYLQTYSPNHLFRHSGTAEEWRDQIGRYCSGNGRLILAVSSAFAAPLLDPLNGEGGGWHFTGQTSTGKTTTLFVAGSVQGGGGEKGFIRRWRATINGLETIAEAHNGALLCLDEIAECRPDDVNESSYMLSNGQGRARQARSGGLRHTSTWCLIFLSSGETSLADHVAQTGKRIRGGQEVRVINLPADAGKGMGLFENIHGFPDADQFARYLKRASCESYGAAIRAFIRKIAGNFDKLQADYKNFEAELLAEMMPKNAASEVGRVAHRFVLAAFAGELATEYGLTGWEPDEATSAAKTLFQVWIDARGTAGSSDDANAIRQIRRFLELHGASRFQWLRRKNHLIDESDENVISEERPIQHRAGYIEKSTNEKTDEESVIYYVLPEVFRTEMCAGFDHKAVARALDKHGCLLKSHDLRYDKRLPEGKQKVYAILSDVLFTGDTGDTGDKP